MTFETLQAGSEIWAAAMVRSLIWGSLVLGLAGLADRAIGLLSPRLRSWIWRSAQIKVLLLVMGLGGISISGDWSLGSASDSQVAHPIASIQGPRPSLPVSPAWSRARGLDALDRSPWMIGLQILWMGGFGWTAIQLLRQGALARSLVRESLEPFDPSLLACLSRWRMGAPGDSPRRRRLKLQIPIRVHDGVTSPQVSGVLRPVILIPPDAYGIGGESSLISVLEHELSHVVGWDLFWRWLRGWLRSLLFFHPLVAWSDRRATSAEEMACDRSAVAHGRLSPAEYGRTLLPRFATDLRLRSLGPSSSIAGLSRHAESLAERLRGLAFLGCRLSRRQILLAAVLFCGVLPLGWVSLGTPRGVLQRDHRFPVLGFQVSRGTGHDLTVYRESLRLFGMGLSRVRQVSGDQTSSLNQGWVSRLADRFSAWGLHPDYQTSHSTLGFGSDADGYAFFVRFGRPPGSDLVDRDRLRAELVDEAGETIPLVEHDRLLPRESSATETLRIWTLEPAPISVGHFNLRLVDSDSGKEVALLLLGSLGGHKPMP